MFKNIKNPKNKVPRTCFQLVDGAGKNLEVWKFFSDRSLRVGLEAILNFWLERGSSQLILQYIEELAYAKCMVVEDFEMKIFPEKYNVFTVFLNGPSGKALYCITAWKITSSQLLYTRYDLKIVRID